MLVAWVLSLALIWYFTEASSCDTAWDMDLFPFSHELQLTFFRVRQLQLTNLNSYHCRCELQLKQPITPIFFSSEELNSLEKWNNFWKKISGKNISFSKIIWFSKLFNSSELKKVAIIGDFLKFVVKIFMSCNGYRKSTRVSTHNWLQMTKKRTC